MVFELLNNRNETIGKQTLRTSGSWGLNWSGRPAVSLSSPDRKTLTFEGVSAQSISDNMMVRVVSINEESAEAAIADGVLKIQAITPMDVAIWDSFNFEKGEIISFQAPHPNVSRVGIPSIIWGEPVLSIGARAFIHHKLKAVSIPHSVNSIGEDAFRLDGDDATVIRIRIGENVRMSYSSITIYFHPKENEEIPCKFFDSYRSQNKKAGTYDIILSSRYTLGSKSFNCFVAADDSSGDRTAALTVEKKKSRNSKIWWLVTAAAVCVIYVLLTDGKGGQ